VSRILAAPVFALVVVVFLVADDQPKPKKTEVPAGFVAVKAAPDWIWLGKAKDDQTVYFRKEFEIKTFFTVARLYASCDNAMTIYIDGKEVASKDGWETPLFKDVADALMGKNFGQGKHVLAVRGVNREGPAGLLVRLIFDAGREPFALVTDKSWRASEKAGKDKAGKMWSEVGFDDTDWKHAESVAKLGDPPWGDRINEATLMAAVKMREPSATPAESLKVAKDFKVELIYSVPKDEQGSWVNMCVDPNGRLIVSDQYGPLYRVTPPALGAAASTTTVEKLDLPLGEAHGLLYAFDSLYVVVNEGQKYKRGLHRARSRDGGDTFEQPELLRELEGGGEHGPHAVILAPDGKSLYVLCGNMTRMTELNQSLVPRLWGEDHLLPRVPDGNGFMAGVLGPGGCIYRVDPDGKKWDLASTGYRNPFDIAFNRHGELFTYDADMEWDMNTPWYRPTRVCLVTSGSEFGWRNGAGKWPPYYPDNLPGFYNVGPGSPTGMTFGYGAKFTAKYQEALFICDWSYGKLYALHVTPEGSAYKGEIEEFINGSPLPLTDVVINPKDGAMYFTIGGRQTKSGLYRVTYSGKESTAPSKGDDRGAELRALRHKMESFHGHRDPQAVEAAWPCLGHKDRYIRFAARVAIEHQDPKTWQDRALAEKEPQAALTALLALVRASASDPFHRKKGSPLVDEALKRRMLEALQGIEWEKLNDDQQLELVRIYGLVFNRMGKPDETARKQTIARFDALYPSGSRILNGELCQLLVYLEAPTAAKKTMAMLARAPTQEEQIDYVKSLRMLKTGWTPELRKQYFSWFLKAGTFKGGASFGGFMRLIKNDAVALLTNAEKKTLQPILDAKPESAPVVASKPRPFVKKWTVDDLAPIVEKGLSKRDFDRGRSLFGEAKCFACHRYDNEGGSSGPDLTGAAGRFSVRDLLESIVEPSKVISDQYAAVIIATTDGKAVIGRIVNLFGDSIMVNTDMLDPNALVNVDRRRVETMEPSKVSMMPEGLIDTFTKEEILDLVAYLLSRGDRKNKMFEK
jgi:putative heme-binding domain-containing protein